MKKTFLVLLGAALFLAAPACEAHEKRKVGEYEFVVGFLHEPAFSGQLNAADLRVTRGGRPVQGLEGTLRAAVFHGDASRPLELKPRYGKPGTYAGYFIPSVAGHYAFRFEGKAGVNEVKETFDSAGGKFSPVADSAVLVFPPKENKTNDL